MEIQQYIDYTLLKATATPSDIVKLCSEAKFYNFYAVCVNGCYVKLAKSELKDSDVKVAAVVGFPLGAMDTRAKISEAKFCVEDGAEEIDMVLNIGWLKSGKLEEVQKEIQLIKNAIGKTILKVIIETCYLSEEEKVQAIKAVISAKADFVKTSTGFGPSGATLADVRLMRELSGDTIGIKASGGIKDRQTALDYIHLGVSRIGTSSGKEIIGNPER